MDHLSEAHVLPHTIIPRLNISVNHIQMSMSSTASRQPKIAFFGATGGCTFAALVHTLRAGIPATALARTPSKLTSLLESQGVDAETISRLLTIVSGNAHDVSAVQTTLTPNGQLVDLIATGLGGTAAFHLNWRHPLQIFTLDDVNVCETSTRTLMSALENIYTGRPSAKDNKPLITFISTTGISRGPEDVPFFIRFLYHQMLTIPHVDKKAMENLIRDNVDGKDGKEKLFRNLVGIRPTLLSGTTDIKEGLGWEKIRSGTEPKPAIGYSVKRADVGEWIFQNVIQSEDKRRTWEGQLVSLTS